MGKPIEWRAIEWRAIANKASWGVYDELGNRICTINTASTRQESTAKLMAQAPALAAEVERLREVMGDIAALLVGEGDAAELAARRLRKALNESEAALARQEAKNG